jgi:hypothetical protein
MKKMSKEVSELCRHNSQKAAEKLYISDFDLSRRGPCQVSPDNERLRWLPLSGVQQTAQIPRIMQNEIGKALAQ